MTIVLPEDPTPQERYAADLLKDGQRYNVYAVDGNLFIPRQRRGAMRMRPIYRVRKMAAGIG